MQYFSTYILFEKTEFIRQERKKEKTLKKDKLQMYKRLYYEICWEIEDIKTKRGLIDYN